MLCQILFLYLCQIKQVNIINMKVTTPYVNMNGNTRDSLKRKQFYVLETLYTCKSEYMKNAFEYFHGRNGRDDIHREELREDYTNEIKMINAIIERWEERAKII